jgi:hypothetical protein
MLSRVWLRCGIDWHHATVPSTISSRTPTLQRRTSGTQSLTSGDAITMVDQNGGTLARPVRLTDYTFKVVFG